MRKRSLFVGLVILFVGVWTVAAAASPFMGTWNLNEGKSKLSGKAKNTKVVYEAAGDNVKVTIDGVDAEGKAVHTEWTGKFDGKDYPVTGAADKETRSYKQLNARTLSVVDKADGKVRLSGKLTVSADGKSRTAVISSTDDKGKKTSSTMVYDKE
jgi:hypothetical protein